MGTERKGNLQFVCGLCETRLNVRSLFAGKKINCPKCHKKVVVPRQSAGIATAPAAAGAQKKTAVPGGDDAPARQGRSAAGRKDLDALRAENKALRERLAGQTDHAPAAAGSAAEDLAQARKRITELERQLSELRAADPKAGARTSVPTQAGKESA